jgi:hypothetical protein
MSTVKRRAKDARGNSYDKRARKRWLLSPDAPYGGNGSKVKCVHCLTDLTYETVESDRIQPGGTYARHNVQPSCRHCNASRGDNPNWIPPRLRSTVGVA